MPTQALAQRTDADGHPRQGPQVGELTQSMPPTFTGWPPAVIARRIIVFATDTRGARPAELEVRHRLRTRAEDRIRGLKDTGDDEPALQAFAKNQIWLELVQLAAQLLT